MSASSPSPTSPPSLVPPPSTSPPPPSSSSPSISQPAPSSPPPSPSSNSSNSSPRPAPPQSPPPNSSQPPSVSQSPSPPSTPSPPPASPPAVSPPPPPPPKAVLPPPTSPPPISSPPPPIPLSPPPPTKPPPPVSPAPSSPSPPPPEAVSPLPPPPSNVPSPPPPISPPTPSAKPPENSPSPPVLPSPAPSVSHLSPPPPPTSVPNPSPPPPRDSPQPVSPPPPPSNSSARGTPPSPPVPSPTTPGSADAPSSPTPTKSSNSTNNTVGSGNASPTSNGGIHTGTVVAIAIGVGIVVLSLIGLVIWFVRRQKKRVARFGGGYAIPTPLSSSYKSGPNSPYSIAASSTPLVGNGPGRSGRAYSPPEPDGLANSRSWFTYQELSEATNGFSEQNLLGEGGFGSVYKGCLPDGRYVAVKQLKAGGGQGEREFRAEVEIISRVHHRHLVSLVGYCIYEHQRLLVYDYVSNNTLHYHLHGEGRPVMDWATRVKVAAGAARGIAYLHEDCHPRIIHRDIKSSNILLDDNFDAQVSDFGLAKLALDSFTHVTTRVMGTFGYLAPEYASSGKLTEKSDVYSFGVVLLELVTGRKPVDVSQPMGDESLVEWARPLLINALDGGDFQILVDPRLEKNYVDSEIFRLIEAAAACVRHSAIKRPRMGQVVRALDGISDSGDLSNGLTPGQSELFVSTQDSAEIRLFQRMAFGNQTFGTDFYQTSWSSEREL